MADQPPADQLQPAPRWLSSEDYENDVNRFMAEAEGLEGEILRLQLRLFLEDVDNSILTRLGSYRMTNAKFCRWLRLCGVCVQFSYSSKPDYGDALKKVVDAEEALWTKEEVRKVAREGVIRCALLQRYVAEGLSFQNPRARSQQRQPVPAAAASQSQQQHQSSRRPDQEEARISTEGPDLHQQVRDARGG
jgi:hypothetical protein